MGDFKTGRISLGSSLGENKTGRIQSCIQYKEEELKIKLKCARNQNLKSNNSSNISQTYIISSCMTESCFSQTHIIHLYLEVWCNVCVKLHINSYYDVGVKKTSSFNLLRRDAKRLKKMLSRAINMCIITITPTKAVHAYPACIKLLLMLISTPLPL